MQLKLSDWAHIAEIIGGVAIIASLIFVGVQIEENSRAVRSATFQAITDSDLMVISQLTASPELAAAVYDFQFDPESVPRDVSLQASTWAILVLRHAENVYEQYLAGTVTEDRWMSMRKSLTPITQTRGGVCWVTQSRFFPLFSDRLLNEVLLPQYDQSPYKGEIIDCPDMY